MTKQRRRQRDQAARAAPDSAPPSSEPASQERPKEAQDETTDHQTPTTPPDQPPGGQSHTPLDGGAEEAGDVLSRSVSVGTAVAELAREPESRARASNRWILEGRRWEVERFRKDQIRRGVAAGLTRSDAGDRAWELALERFPPLAPHLATSPPPQGDSETMLSPDVVSVSEFPKSAGVGVDGSGGRLRGLHDLPASWPELPANASLQAEVGWVQANRLRVVEETASGATVVHLERALSPAPSWSALGWLETSIRSYAKFIEVAAKVTATASDEADQVRREKMRIEEIRELLAEMMPPRS